MQRAPSPSMGCELEMSVKGDSHFGAASLGGAERTGRLRGANLHDCHMDCSVEVSVTHGRAEMS